MGTYGLNPEEIADKLESVDFQSNLEGDFYEETFILGAIEYIKRLRKLGAFIYTDKKKIIKKFAEELDK